MNVYLVIPAPSRPQGRGCGTKQRRLPTRRSPCRSGRIPALAILFVLFTVSTVHAQESSRGQDFSWASDPLGDVAFLSINATIGGLTAGLWQEISGGSFADGFARGSLGGSVVYAGKRLAAETFFGAGFLGRGLASAGSSLVRNAADGKTLFEEVIIPVGPLRLYARSGAMARPRVEIHLGDLYWTAYGLLEDRLTLDLEESLSSGAPVFRSSRLLVGSGGDIVGGSTAAGVIFVGPHSGTLIAEALPHERIHVIQHDFYYHAWFRPLEDQVLRRLPREGFVHRVDYDLMYPGLNVLASELGWSDRFHGPSEAEAEFLGAR